MNFTSRGWTVGETVTVYAAPATPGAALGASVTTAVADATGAIALTGLTPETNYVAIGGTSLLQRKIRTGVARVIKIVALTQAAYNLLTPPAADTLYVITG